MARPPIYTDDTTVCVSAKSANTKLQTGSDRRAIINYLIEVGGRATLAEIDERFGFSIRDRVLSLLRSGWLEVVDETKEAQ